MNGEKIPDPTQEAAFRRIKKEKAWKAKATMGVVYAILELLGYIPEEIIFREPYGKRWKFGGSRDVSESVSGCKKGSTEHKGSNNGTQIRSDDSCNEK